MTKKRSKLTETTKATAMLIAMYIRNAMENFHSKHLTDEQMQELNPIIQDAICTALYAIENYNEDVASKKLIDFQFMLIPSYWETPRLTDEFTSLAKKVDESNEPPVFLGLASDNRQLSVDFNHLFVKVDTDQVDSGNCKPSVDFSQVFTEEESAEAGEES